MVKMIEDTITRDKSVLKIVVVCKRVEIVSIASNQVTWQENVLKSKMTMEEVISVNEETIIILTLTIELRLKVKMFKLQEVGKSKDKVVVGATEVRLAN